MIVLGLDQSSTSVGFACGEPGGKPSWGCYEVPDYAGHDGRTFWAIVNWLVEVIKCQGVERVYWEQVHIGVRDTNMLFKLFSAANAVQAACVDARSGIEIEDRYVTTGEWRAHFLGTARGHRAWFKEAAKRACLDRGWLVDNEHAAEALGIWDYGCTLCDRQYKWASGGRIRRAQAKAQALA